MVKTSSLPSKVGGDTIPYSHWKGYGVEGWGVGEAVKGDFGGNGVEPLVMVMGLTVRMIMSGSGDDEGEENTDGGGG